MFVDAHQHLWTEPLIEALAARRALPLVRREQGDWVLHLAGEPPCVVVPDAPTKRAWLLREDETDVALVALSSPLGIEALAPDEAHALIDAHTRGVRSFGPLFPRWGAIPLAEPDPADVDRQLDGGAVGLSLPAGALASPRDLHRLGPVLERLSARGAPLFVHPGPNPWTTTHLAGAVGPAWWPALTTYVSQMQAAWLTFVTEGQLAHPRLRVLFALLAGGTPLHAERLAARGGPVVDPSDARLFYDTSSHGPRALAALGVTGIQLVHGSDRPVTGPATPVARSRAVDAPARLLRSFLPSTPVVNA